MRRALSTIVVAAVAAGIAAIPSTAGALASITTRSDRNDSTNVLDIRKIGTDVSARKVFTGIRSWDPFVADDVTFQHNSFFVFLLDTKGRGAADKILYLGYDENDSRFECNLFNRDGGFKGEVKAQQDADVIQCVTPRAWYDIQKTVKFGVESYDHRDFQDRAPNDSRYVGL